MSIRSLISGDWMREKVRSSEAYRSAVDFCHDYKPTPSTDYAWVLDHAAKEFEQTSARVAGLDAKAESLIGYLGAGSGIISVALAFGLEPHPKLALWIGAPPLLMLLVAVLLALSSRTPALMPALPHTRDALMELDAAPLVAKGKLAAYIWMSSQGLSLTAREKARLIRTAFALFAAAVSWLVVASIISRVVGH